MATVTLVGIIQKLFKNTVVLMITEDSFDHMGETITCPQETASINKMPEQ